MPVTPYANAVFRTPKPSVPAPSAPFDGLCTYTGLAILVMPIEGGKPNVLLFDAQIWVGNGPTGTADPSPENFITGQLAYYNANNTTFYEEPTFFNITCSFAAYHRNMISGEVDVASDGIQFCGDIEMLLPIGTYESTTVDENSDGFPCGHFSVDAEQGGMIFASGLATKCDRDKNTFSMNLSIYIGGMRKQENVPRSSMATITLHCFFPANSPRWKNSKPTPYERRCISVAGRLTGFAMAPPSPNRGAPPPRPSMFSVEILHITFLGTPSSTGTTTASPSSIPNTLDSPTPGAAKGLIAAYGKKRKVAQPTSSAQPLAPISASSRNANTPAHAASTHPTTSGKSAQPRKAKPTAATGDLRRTTRRTGTKRTQDQAEIGDEDENEVADSLLPEQTGDEELEYVDDPNAKPLEQAAGAA
ncbi:hypothetical protein DFP72DRAFT_844456 [Ephemerocybe angulata]|uniref:Uncharacterized protein n=1 Tax=Ephemerocybe angulata TaxID=980116 RepID=A0A8H6I794_9AGAR|nr:hypothetical protein DFP72DRAFT_844456 [Tulosesus angulatus]